MIIVDKIPIFEKVKPDGNKHIELKRSEKRKGTLDCVITLTEISPQSLILLGNEIDNMIRIRSKNFKGWTEISPDTSRQLHELSQLIILHRELTSEIVKNV